MLAGRRCPQSSVSGPERPTPFGKNHPARGPASYQQLGREMSGSSQPRSESRFHCLALGGRVLRSYHSNSLRSTRIASDFHPGLALPLLCPRQLLTGPDPTRSCAALAVSPRASTASQRTQILPKWPQTRGTASWGPPHTLGAPSPVSPPPRALL